MKRFGFVCLFLIGLWPMSAVADTDGICGGIAGIACGGSEFCDFPIEAQCGAGDRSGICTPRPGVCTMDFNPVCGCDGKTYPNACGANTAGISVAQAGECP